MTWREEHGAARANQLRRRRVVFGFAVIPMGQADIVAPKHIIAQRPMHRAQHGAIARHINQHGRFIRQGA